MQTFLPYSCFTKSAICLDSRRHGKQRQEALGALVLNLGFQPKWMSDRYYAYLQRRYRNHPAVKMWKGYEAALCIYGIVMCREWAAKGKRDNTMWKFLDLMRSISLQNILMPRFIGNKDFHAAMRSNLLRKDPVYYGQFRWTEPSNLPYIWNIK